MTAKGPRSGSRLASVTVAVLGALGLVLMAGWVLLAFLTRDLQASRDGAAVAFALACGLLGILVARRQPRNPEGWLLLAMAVGVIALLDSGLYAVLDYRVDHGRLPVGEVAVIVRGSMGEPLIFLFALIILLFPTGRLTRRWTWVLRLYLVFAVTATVGFVANEAGSVAGQHIQVDVNGTYSGQGSPGGVLGVLAFAGAGFLLVPLFWPAFAGRQVLSWRRSAGDRRQQLKWLMGGALLAVPGLALIAFGPSADQTLGRVTREDEHQAVSFADRIGADTARRPAGALGQIRYLRDAAVSAVGPGVIAAAQRVAFHDAHAQRYLAVGAPVLQCVHCATLAAVQRDPLTREHGSERFFLPNAPGYSDWIPKIRIDPGTPEISNGSGMAMLQLVPATRRSGPYFPILGGKCLGHALLPCTQVTDYKTREREISGVNAYHGYRAPPGAPPADAAGTTPCLSQ